MPCEVKVIIKDEEKTLKKSFLIYEELTASDTDPIIKRCIDETLLNFNGEPSSVSVKISIEMA